MENKIDKSLQYNYILIIDEMTFEWDPNKAESNEIKHKISFKEAASVFADTNGLVIADPDHSSEEERFIIIGRSAAGNCLTVVHCCKDKETIIRIISARRATKNETAQYANSMN